MEGAIGEGGAVSGTHGSKSTSQESRGLEEDDEDVPVRREEKRSGEREERATESGLADNDAASSNTAPKVRGVEGGEKPSLTRQNFLRG